MKLMLCAVLSVLSLSVTAQNFPIVDNGGTSSLNASTDIRDNSVVVGVSTSGNTLEILEGVHLFAANGYVSYGSGSSDNRMELKAGAFTWYDGEFAVGAAGADNEFLMVNSTNLSQLVKIGALQTADRNTAVIRGAFSHWESAGDFVIGEAGSDNQLLLEDQAEVYAGRFFIGAMSSAMNNEVIVSNSFMATAGPLVVGDGGSSNSLQVISGGFAAANEVWVGAGTNANGNSVRLSGSGTVLQVADAVYLGSSNNVGNRVIVNNGASVTLADLVIEGTNWFDLNAGGTLTATTNFNAAADGFNWNSGSTLKVGGILTGMTGSIESNRTLGVSGSWNTAGSNVVVGGSSSDNTLQVYDGGQVVVSGLTVGATNAAGNTVQVSTAGKLSVSGAVSVYDGNLLTVTNGGWLSVSNDFDAGQSGFNFAAGGILETTGALTMTNVLDGSKTLLLTGGTWDTGTNQLAAGADTGNTLIEVRDGGLLDTSGAVIGLGAGASNNGVLIEGAGSAWNNAGRLTVGGAGSMNYLVITNGGMAAADELVVGDSGAGNTLLLTGTGSRLDYSGRAAVGLSGSGNRLVIRENAVLSGVDGAVGGTGTDNWALISGAGSLWEGTGDLTIEGAGSGVMISDGALVDFSQMVSLQQGAALDIEGDAAVDAGSYVQDGLSVLSFSSITNIAVDPGAALVEVAGSASFESNAVVRFNGSIADADVGVTNSRKIVSSAALIVGGITNAVGSDLDPLFGEVANGLFAFEFYAQNDDLFMQLYRQSLAESAGFESNSQMYAVANEIDDLASAGDQNAVNQLNVLGNMPDGAAQNAQLTQLYERNAPTFMHMEGLFEGMRQVQRRGVMPDTYWPVGPGGPHLYGEQTQLWFKGFGSWGNQDAEGSFSGYDQSVYGMVIGMDKAFGDLLVGAAGGYSTSKISQDDGDSSDSGMGYGILYGSWGTADWFADGSLALGLGSVENKTGTAFDTTSDFDSGQFGFYLGGGKEMIFRKDTVFLTPTAAMLGGNYWQDGYTEKSSNAVAKKVDDYNRWSFKSDIGVEAVFRKELRSMVLMPDVHAKWLHEFNDDADSVGYTLEGGTGNYSYAMAAPVSDLFELGAGLSLWTENKNDSVYEFALGYDVRFGSGYMANILTARMNVEF